MFVVAILTEQSEEDGSGQSEGGRDSKSSSILEFDGFNDLLNEISGPWRKGLLCENVHLVYGRSFVGVIDSHLRSKSEIVSVGVCLR